MMEELNKAVRALFIEFGTYANSKDLDQTPQKAASDLGFVQFAPNIGSEALYIYTSFYKLQ